MDLSGPDCQSLNDLFLLIKFDIKDHINFSEHTSLFALPQTAYGLVERSVLASSFCQASANLRDAFYSYNRGLKGHDFIKPDHGIGVF